MNSAIYKLSNLTKFLKLIRIAMFLSVKWDRITYLITLLGEVNGGDVYKELSQVPGTESLLLK